MAFTIIIALALALVLFVLGLGVISMARGGEFNKKYGNRLMQLRVVAQAVVVLLLFMAFLFDN